MEENVLLIGDSLTDGIQVKGHTETLYGMSAERFSGDGSGDGTLASIVDFNLAFYLSEDIYTHVILCFGQNDYDNPSEYLNVLIEQARGGPYNPPPEVYVLNCSRRLLDGDYELTVNAPIIQMDLKDEDYQTDLTHLSQKGRTKITRLLEQRIRRTTDWVYGLNHSDISDIWLF